MCVSVVPYLCYAAFDAAVGGERDSVCGRVVIVGRSSSSRVRLAVCNVARVCRDCVVRFIDDVVVE